MFVVLPYGLETLLQLSNALRFYVLKTNSTFKSDRKLRAQTKYLRGKRTTASKCSSRYHKSGLETSLPLSNTLRFYKLKITLSSDREDLLAFAPITSFQNEGQFKGSLAFNKKHFPILPNRQHSTREYSRFHPPIKNRRRYAPNTNPTKKTQV